jgi:hypothetical protein
MRHYEGSAVMFSLVAVVLVALSEPTSYTWSNQTWTVRFHELREGTNVTIRLRPSSGIDAMAERKICFNLAESTNVVASVVEFLAMVRRHKTAKLTDDLSRPIEVTGAKTSFTMEYHRGAYYFSRVPEAKMSELLDLLRRVATIAREVKRKATF